MIKEMNKKKSKNSSFIIHPSSLNEGFTLIEVLAAITVLVVIGTIVGSIFLSSVKGTTRATTLSVARQNGAYALSQIEKTIRNAQAITSSPNPCAPIPTPASSITILGVDNTTTAFACTGSTLTSNGGSLIDTSSLAVASCSFSCIQSSSADYPTITTQFTITQVRPNSFFEQKASIPFQTSVTLRNLSR